MSSRQIICFALISSLLLAPVAFSQEAQKPADDVIRITTELVQTGVVVVDKQGKFVEGLKPEQFLLKVDGQPMTPAFVEHVITGTAREQKVETSGANLPAPATASSPSYRGRTIIFFIDDLHLSADSVQRTRKGILEFVENEMSIEDQVAVASPSGQIGFLERFSDVKGVVRAAVNRLNHKPYSVRDYEQIPMTEFQALRIEEGDNAAADYFVTEMMKANNFKVPGGLGPPSGGPTGRPLEPKSNMSGMTPEAARRVVKDRASFLLRQSESVTTGTLSSLESLMRSVSQARGRKVVFLISDGFFMNDRSTGMGEKIHRIADAAVRGGVIVYSLDARGLISMIDAGSNRTDPLGQLSRANVGEFAASQAGLNALADNTGGKLFTNTPITSALDQALKETSNYYLVAWRPNTQAQKSANFKRIEVSIVGRPELTVRLPRGFFSVEPKTEDKRNETAEAANANSKPVEAALISALAAPTARTSLPTNLAVSFIDVPGSGPVMTAATQMATDVLGYGADGKQPAAIDLAGVVLNDLGKQAGGFKTRINVNPLSATATVQNPTVQYSHKLPLKPGIYQVRVAARDDKSGRVGSAAQWIEIPDLNSKKLTLSSLLVGGEFIGANRDAAQEQMVFSVDRRFTQGSQMTFLTMIYNAGTAPRLDSQIEILRGGQRIIASPVRPIVIDDKTDLARIPYGATVALRTLPPGRYVLRVTVNDRNANTSAMNQVLFEIV
ncbi:MAG TPA: VWA domain-containing protein [Pyrinomonadaceae bacterium]